MPRNLFERCEVVFPVRDPAALARIHDEILPAYLADTVKARQQQADGSYIRASKTLKGEPPFSAQDFLMRLAEGKIDISAIPKPAAVKSHRPPRATASGVAKPARSRRPHRKAVAAD
jgi:polyphosphate kinase